MTKFLQIGPANLKLELGTGLEALEVFLNRFPDADNENFNGTIIFRLDSPRQILVDKSKKILQLIGPDLNQIDDTAMTIVALQVLFRFANLVTFSGGPNPWLLLHGSAAMWDK